MASEPFEGLVGLICARIPEQHRGQIRCISTDSPLKLMSNIKVLKNTFKSLEVVEEGAAHVGIRLERCSCCHVTGLSLRARRLCNDFFLRPCSIARDDSYRWCGAEDVRRAGTGFLAQPQMEEIEAQRILEVTSEGEVTPERFGLCVRAILVLSQSDASRREGKGRDSRTLGQVLETQLSHFGFLKNVQIRRSHMAQSERDVEAVGTAGKKQNSCH